MPTVYAFTPLREKNQSRLLLFFFFIFYPLEIFCFSSLHFFENEGKKGGLSVSRRADIKVHSFRLDSTQSSKVIVRLSPIFFFNEHIDTVDDEMWARPRKPDPD